MLHRIGKKEFGLMQIQPSLHQPHHFSYQSMSGYSTHSNLLSNFFQIINNQYFDSMNNFTLKKKRCSPSAQFQCLRQRQFDVQQRLPTDFIRRDTGFELQWNFVDGQQSSLLPLVVERGQTLVDFQLSSCFFTEPPNQWIVCRCHFVFIRC